VTPVGNGALTPRLGLILPATLQEELPDENGITSGSTPSTAHNLAELFRRAEATGADSLWVVDHLYWPHPINECLTTLAIGAGATRRPTLGSCILQLPLRHPPAVAKQASALQHLSGGRFILGVGVGSHPDEYEQAGVDYHRRGRLMDEGIAKMHEAWASADGAVGAADPAAPRYRQLPPSPRVPLWIGGSSPAARRRAAAVGDGWAPLFITPDDYGPALRALRQETEASGRHPDAVEPAVVVFARVDSDDETPERGAAWLSDMYGVPPKAFERHLVAGEPETCAAALGQYVEAGARHIIVMVAGTGAVGHFERLRSAFVARSHSVSHPVPAEASA
jgi:alkanesulfonate monooxygenase SsuD/methylene tetrahydromethanopterin reductase-like flavin-dependent oxidoreductase (luciferase family)